MSKGYYSIAPIRCTFALIKQLFPTHFFLFNDVAFFIFRLNALQLLHLRVLLRSDVLLTVPYIHTYIHTYITIIHIKMYCTCTPYIHNTSLPSIISKVLRSYLKYMHSCLRTYTYTCSDVCVYILQYLVGERFGH